MAVATSLESSRAGRQGTNRRAGYFIHADLQLGEQYQRLYFSIARLVHYFTQSKYYLFSVAERSVLVVVTNAFHLFQTGLSPLAAGQWKGLLGTYAGLYVFITLFRPLRLALAVGLTNKVAQLLDQTQERFGCSKPVSAMMVLSAMLSFWVIFATCGITLASTLAGVPIWKGI